MSSVTNEQIRLIKLCARDLVEGNGGVSVQKNKFHHRTAYSLIDHGVLEEVQWDAESGFPFDEIVVKLKLT